MADPTTWLVLQAIATQLSAISIANGYNTDIGTRFFLNAVQRDTTERPSIAIGSGTGALDLTAERTASGNQKSGKARRMDIIVEAAMNADSEDALRVGHLMLEDIDRALAVKSCLAPVGVASVSFLTWTILDHPEGLEAVVLQINGNAEYTRST